MKTPRKSAPRAVGRDRDDDRQSSTPGSPQRAVAESAVRGEDPVRKAATAFRTISEVSDELDVAKHVLRFWELKFAQLRPMKRGGGRRFYRPDDVALLRGIRHLLQAEAFTIKGVQKILREQGADAVKAVGAGGALPSSVPGSRRRPRIAGIQHGPAPDSVVLAHQGGAPGSVVLRPGTGGRELADIVRRAIGELEALREILSVDRSPATLVKKRQSRVAR